jgi:hypothetical protein
MANGKYANSAHEKCYCWQRIDPIGDVPREYRSVDGAYVNVNPFHTKSANVPCTIRIAQW